MYEGLLDYAGFPWFGRRGGFGHRLEASMQLPCLVETVMMSFALAI